MADLQVRAGPLCLKAAVSTYVILEVFTEKDNSSLFGKSKFPRISPLVRLSVATLWFNHQTERVREIKLVTDL